VVKQTLASAMRSKILTAPHRRQQYGACRATTTATLATSSARRRHAMMTMSDRRKPSNDAGFQGLRSKVVTAFLTLSGTARSRRSRGNALLVRRRARGNDSRRRADASPRDTPAPCTLCRNERDRASAAHHQSFAGNPPTPSRESRSFGPGATRQHGCRRRNSFIGVDRPQRKLLGHDVARQGVHARQLPFDAQNGLVGAEPSAI